MSAIDMDRVRRAGGLRRRGTDPGGVVMEGCTHMVDAGIRLMPASEAAALVGRLNIPADDWNYRPVADEAAAELAEVGVRLGVPPGRALPIATFETVLPCYFPPLLDPGIARDISSTCVRRTHPPNDRGPVRGRRRSRTHRPPRRRPARRSRLRSPLWAHLGPGSTSYSSSGMMDSGPVLRIHCPGSVPPRTMFDASCGDHIHSHRAAFENIQRVISTSPVKWRCATSTPANCTKPVNCPSQEAVPETGMSAADVLALSRATR